MSDAPKDQNFVKAKLGVLFSDGVTLIPLAIDSSNGGIKVNTTDTISSDILQAVANKIPRDSNFEPAWAAVSSTDGSVLYPIFVDATGAVLIDT